MLQNLIDKIKNSAFKGEVLISDLSLYEIDASIFRIKPEMVVIPEDVDDLLILVNLVKDEKVVNPNSNLSLTVRSAGTDMSGGAINDSIIVDMQKFNKIISIQKFETNTSGIRGQIEVEPGTFYRDIEKELSKVNLMFPSYPASKDLCTIGGIVANNSAGEKTLRYGKTLKYVEEIEMICFDGVIRKFNLKKLDNIQDIKDDVERKIYEDISHLISSNLETIKLNTPKVKKNSSGYYLWNVLDLENNINLAKLICGSQGTLGLITKVKLNLVEKKQNTKMITLMLPKVSDVNGIYNIIHKYDPESFELFDDHTFKIAIKFWRDIFRKIGGNIFTLGISFLPEFFMVLTGGVPKLVIIVEFVEGSEEEALSKARSCFEELKKENERLNNNVKVHLIDTELEARKYWVFRRESFNLLRSKLSGMRTAPFIEDVVVDSESFTEFLPKFEKLLDQANLTYTIAGHVGDGNIHVIPLMKLSEERNVQTIKDLSVDVYSLVKEYKGSISGEHNDGLIRTPFLNMMFDNDMLNLFVEVKRIFDPSDIFNPKKKVNLTWDESLSHIDRTV